ncbi:hypothetical protein J2S05_001814 [Alkalicoccobacillus murimartini]|uniref:Uncharacterized protein n=1 Tax=Alkalicoccobacillus murimartini TaxID=171685 RepID=A0ABT9YHP8_9BACI|nr:hypothetical protein [Alkalicoccobacillus murimartini]
MGIGKESRELVKRSRYQKIEERISKEKQISAKEAGNQQKELNTVQPPNPKPQKKDHHTGSLLPLSNFNFSCKVPPAYKVHEAE